MKVTVYAVIDYDNGFALGYGFTEDDAWADAGCPSGNNLGVEPIACEVINLTPHSINLRGNNGEITLPSSGNARAEQMQDVICKEDVLIVKNVFGDPVDLPDPCEGKVYVVSTLTAQAAKSINRATWDLLVPTNPIRDEAGRIVACGALAVV